MTIHDDLDRLAQRGTPAGADSVFDAAVGRASAEDYETPVKTRLLRSGASTISRWVAAAAVAALVLGVGAVMTRDSEDVVDTAGGVMNDGQADLSTTLPLASVPAERVESMDMVLNQEVNRSGWVDEHRSLPVDNEIPAPLPVFDESGRQIAWWGFALGWIDLDEMARESYDFRAEYQLELDKIAQLRQERTGS